MREVDDAAVGRASVFVDTIDGAPTEAGDLVQRVSLPDDDDVAA